MMRFYPVFLLPALVLASVCSSAQTVSGTKSVQLTVYNAGFALVKDTRSIDLKKGVNSIEVADVAAKIDPTSILFKPLGVASRIGILEQNYQYDLINPNNILSKLVGERVWFNKGESGVLMNPPANGGLVIKKDDGTILMNVWPNMVDKLPDGLKASPTLNWLLTSANSGLQDAEINYITEGVGWVADYVALVNKNDTALDLTGWVTLNNNSGATYKDAQLTLMAGDVRRIQNVKYSVDDSIALKGDFMMLEKDKKQFEEKSFFEYHMYTMTRPTTISQNESKQISLLNAADVPVKKEMIYDARGDWFRYWWYPGRRDGDPGSGYDTSNYHKVNVILEVKNSKENHMGMPLPKGRIRVYKLDDTGSQQFVGEDQIDHTPKDEKVRLYIGDAFDVVGDYKRTDYKRIDGRTVQESFEVVIRNHKDTAVDVKVVDHVWLDWTVTAKTHAYIKKDASTIEFPVNVPANKNVKINYTIKTTW